MFAVLGQGVHHDRAVDVDHQRSELEGSKRERMSPVWSGRKVESELPEWKLNSNREQNCPLAASPGHGPLDGCRSPKLEPMLDSNQKPDASARVPQSPQEQQKYTGSLLPRFFFLRLVLL